jgi:hypothetical protein
LPRTFWASRAGSKGKTQRDSGNDVPPGFWVQYLRSVIKVSFKVSTFARTVGDNRVVGPIPLSLDWEVLSVMVASVDQYTKTFGLRAGRAERTFSYPLLKNRLLCWKRRSDLQLYPEGERIKRLKLALIPRGDMARTASDQG